MFDFDDPTKSAEDRMSSAVGCMILAAAAAVLVVAGAIAGIGYALWELFR